MALYKTGKNPKKWPRICLYIAIGLIVFAIGLYVYLCQSINAEFESYKEFYGEAYDELYSLSNADKDVRSEIHALGKEAFEFLGTQEECDAFGKLSRYCVNLTQMPEAARCGYTLDLIASGAQGDVGYIWVAYTQTVCDAEGNVLSSVGTEDARCLSRWTIQKIDGKWTVTDTQEP